MGRGRKRYKFRVDSQEVNSFGKFSDFFRRCGLQCPLMKRGRGSKLIDSNRREYLDLFLCSGKLVLGHAHRNVVLASKKFAERGIGFGFSCTEEFEMSSLIRGFFGREGEVKFFSSEQDSLVAAVTAAKYKTKRNKVVLFDSVRGGLSSSFCSSEILSCEYNNIEKYVEIIKEQSDKIACIVLEPLAMHMGLVAADKEFLQVLRKTSSDNGIVLIFDEINSAFHVDSFFVQNKMEVYPDITCLGGVIGGGFSLGVCFGDRDLLDLIPGHGIFSNPVVMSSGLAVLKMMNEDFLNILSLKCGQLCSGLNDYFLEKGSNLKILNYGSMMSFALEDGILSEEAYLDIFKRLFEGGIIISPDELSPFYLSIMHSRKDISSIQEIFKCLV